MMMMMRRSGIAFFGVWVERWIFSKRVMEGFSEVLHCAVHYSMKFEY
jgi:hypothetical protein